MCWMYVIFPIALYLEKFIKDFSIIENDPEIKVVAEVIGGIGAAYDFTVRSLKAGKSVVTSNKELVAQKGYELLQLAKENNVNYFFEASGWRRNSVDSSDAPVYGRQ